MRRETTEAKMGDGRVRYTTRLVGPRCDGGTREYYYYQTDLLCSISAQPVLLNCGPATFETLRVFHDGARWVAEATAIAREA